jgi:peptidoglycan/LPS O-acetylase OafA/YrhL
MLCLRLQNPAPLPAAGHLREIDELKGWAMLLVIIYHTAGMFGFNNWLHGEVGVDIFLIVSGFTLARSSRTLTWQEFLKRRILRIFPAYWLALALFLVLGVYFFGAHRSATNIILHVLGLHAFGKGEYFSDINDSFWFISLILTMYVVFLLLRKHLADLSLVIGTGLLLTTAACWAYAQDRHAGGLSQFAMRIPSFFIGLIIAQLTGPEESKLALSPILGAGLLAITYLGWTRSLIPFYAVAGPAMTAAFLVVRRNLLNHPDGRFLLASLALMGVYSYEIFLFHQPFVRDYNRLILARWFNALEPSNAQLAAGVAVGLLVTFALSFVVHQTTHRLFSHKIARPAALPRDVALS